MRLITLLLVALLGACASSPKAPAPSQETFDHIDANNIAEAQAAGYKVVNQKGSTLLCRKSLLTGTRLQYVTTCLTPMEWKETSDSARAAVKPAPIAKPTLGN